MLLLKVCRCRIRTHLAALLTPSSPPFTAHFPNPAAEAMLIDDLRAKKEKRAKEQAKKDAGLDMGALVDKYRAGMLAGALNADLKAYLKKYNVSVSGLKAELVARVKDHMEKNLRFND